MADIGDGVGTLDEPDHRVTEQARIADVRHKALVGMIQEILDEIRSRSV
ncbi:hypothetical protein N5079_21775 [Planotetraspora sp. A-T 1434]|nr:hypothetical protein [Planotetraspora sp. A-T 1434]MCT9932839.1 hypothetical protein [Planotetraspora sp. A-T 1434]